MSYHPIKIIRSTYIFFRYLKAFVTSFVSLWYILRFYTCQVIIIWLHLIIVFITHIRYRLLLKPNLFKLIHRFCTIIMHCLEVNRVISMEPITLQIYPVYNIQCTFYILLVPLEPPDIIFYHGIICLTYHGFHTKIWSW